MQSFFQRLNELDNGNPRELIWVEKPKKEPRNGPNRSAKTLAVKRNESSAQDSVNTCVTSSTVHTEVRNAFYYVFKVALSTYTCILLIVPLYVLVK